MHLAPVALLEDLPDAVCAALRARCAEAGYTEQFIDEVRALTADVPASINEVVPCIQHALARRGGPAAVLARLLAYDDLVEEPLVRDALGDDVVDALLGAGVLARAAGLDSGLHARFELWPFDGLWILSDDLRDGADAVMPPGPTTWQLAGVMPTAITGAVLDVGCGPGSLALVAARRGARPVIGVDISERAVALARFNARLNGLTDATFLVGDLAEPVRGRRFDLVVAQLPYVIQPPGIEPRTFLHGGPTGDALVMRLIPALPDCLKPGGLALVLVDTPAGWREPLSSRLRAAIGNVPVDLLVLVAPGPSGIAQAITYAALEDSESGAVYRRALWHYLDHLQALGLEKFHHALVVLRARDDGADNPVRGSFTAAVPVNSLRGDAAALDALLAALELAALDDAALVRRAVRASPSVRWVEKRLAPDRPPEPSRLADFAIDTFAANHEVSARDYALISLLHGAHSIADAIEQHVEASGVSRAEATQRVQRLVRVGLMRGVLQPAPVVAAGPEPSVSD